MRQRLPGSSQRLTPALLILGALACFVAAAMFARADGYISPGATYHAVQRILLMVAMVLTAMGFTLLADVAQTMPGGTLIRIGSSAYFFAAVVGVAGEALAFTLGWDDIVPLILVYFLLAYLAQAAIGGGLLQSRLVAPWIGWTTILWNLGWLLAYVVFGDVAAYIPLLHHIMPLVIGIASLKSPRAA